MGTSPLLFNIKDRNAMFTLRVTLSRIVISFSLSDGFEFNLVIFL